MRVAGVMLAGGQSSRMGRTKALIEVDGEMMGRRVLNALRSAGCDPVIIYGGDADELASLDAPVEPDRYPGEGPVGAVAGVLQLLSAAGEYGVVAEIHPDPAADDDTIDGAVVVACDLPALDASVIRSLLAAARANPASVVIARTERIEPLCGYWPIAVRPRVDDAFASGTSALHRVIDELDVVAVDVPADVLRNVNAPADLD